MGLYDLACAAGPTLGPIVAGFAVVANGWRWAFWEMLWITGFALIVLSFTMPEVGLSSSSFLPSHAPCLLYAPSLRWDGHWPTPSYRNTQFTGSPTDRNEILPYLCHKFRHPPLKLTFSTLHDNSNVSSLTYHT